MKSLSDAIRLRAQVLRHMEEANSQCNLSDRQSLLTFVVAGGGFAGVETVAALNDFVREALPFYPSVREEMLRVILVHSGPVILPELGEALGRYTQKVLTGRGVDIRLNTRVKGVTEENVSLVDGSSIPTRNLAWTAGTAPSPLIFSLPCMKAGGRLLVDQSWRGPDWPDVWAVGDCAFVPDMRNPGKSHPPTAQHAMREGKIVAQNIVAALADRPLKSFSFRTIGLLASIGRRMGVARIFGFNFFRSGSYFAGLATSSATRHLRSWSSILLLAPAAIPTATAAAWDGRLLCICKRRKLIPIGSISAKSICRSAMRTNVMACQARKNWPRRLNALTASSSPRRFTITMLLRRPRT